MSRQIFAIDIRTASISALVLTAGLKSLTVDAAAVIAIDEPPSEGQDGLTDALKRLQDRLVVANPMVIVGLPGKYSFYRRLTVPFADPGKIRQILAFELEPTLAIPVERMVFGFSIQSDQDHHEVLAAVTDHHYMDSILECMAQIGLSPQTIVPGGFALAAVMARHHELPEQCMLLDVDGSQPNLLALVNNQVLMARSLQIDMTADHALRDLALKIGQTLSGYNDTAATKFQPTTLYVSGHPISNTWADRLNMMVEAVDLRGNIPKLETGPTLDPQTPAISDGALALALVQAEGIPCPVYHRSGSVFHDFWEAYKPYLKGPAVLATLAIILFLAGMFWDIHVLRQRADRLQTDIAAAMISAFPDIGPVGPRPADQMNSKLLEFKKNLVDPALATGQGRIIDILYQISTLIPKDADVVLNRMVVGSDGITIAGETVDFNTVEDIKSRLEKSALFDQAEITSSDRDKSGQKVNFRLKLVL